MKHKYSATEQHLLSLLSSQPVSTTALAKAHYGHFFKKRKAPQQTVTWTLNSLRKKLKENREPITVCSSEFAGPYEMEHWIVKKS